MLKVKYLNHNLQRRCPSLPYLKFFVRHLPPATLYVKFPPNYPSKSPPKFRISISWLPAWETSRICQKLDELWYENEGNEILFIWMNFLKFELLGFLQIQYCLDVSLLFTAFEEPEYYLESDLSRLSDSRATNDNMFLNPKVYLAKYDSNRHHIEFGKSFYLCKICLEEFSGMQCVEFNRCGHVYCKTCTTEYVTLCIRERRVNCILCPEQNCKSEVAPDQIKELVPPESYERYERLLLQVTLDSMNDIVYCPRVECQYPATKDGDDNLVTCANCLYNFCAYCRKVYLGSERFYRVRKMSLKFNFQGYHGVAPCHMTSQDRSKLVIEYQAANIEQKKLLEKKYGRKQLQIVVEKHLTDLYLKVACYFTSWMIKIYVTSNVFVSFGQYIELFDHFHRRTRSGVQNVLLL